MGYTAKKNSRIFVVEETTEGTYKAASLGTEAIQPLADGFEIKPTKETLERNILSGSIGVATPRTGMKSVSANIPCEFRASDIEGDKPDYDLLLKGALGGSRSIATEVSTTTGNTVTLLKVADSSLFKVGDIVLVKIPGKFHVSPVKSVTANTVELLIACPSVPADGVKIAPVQMYCPADSGHPSLTVERWIEGTRKETATGCKVTGMTVSNFSTGKLADLSFKLEGMGFNQEVGVLGVTPSFQESLPPIMLSAYVYQDGVEIPINELSLSIENSLGFITSTASENGKISSRVTSRTVKGSINPYKQGDSVANFTKFNTNSSFSLFAYAKNPTAVSGEFSQVVAIYLPCCLITELSESDKDGILQEGISFSASRGTTGANDEVFIATI